MRGELIRSLMRASRGSYLLAAALMPAMVGLSWGHVPAWQLIAWFIIGIAATSCRIWGEQLYARHYADRDSAAQQYFVQRYRHLWSASAFAWGLSILIFFERTPLVNQFMSWLIVAGVATFPLNGLALHPPLLKRYVNTLFFTMLAAIVFRVIELNFERPHFHYGFLLLPGLHWWLLLRAGRRIHETARNSFELLFHNHILIDSLTQQRQAAVAAVEMKNRFLASAAHDMRQPVQALALYADWLRNEPELVHEIAPKIVRATHAVNALFDSLFDLARIDSGKVRLNIERGRRGAAAARPGTAVPAGGRGQGPALSGARDARHGADRSDPLRRMIGNLIANAIKYTQRGRRAGGLAPDARRPARGGVGHRHRHRARAPARGVPGVLQGGRPCRHLGRLRAGPVHRGAPVARAGPPGRACASRPGRGSVFRVALHDADEAQAQTRISGAGQADRRRAGEGAAVAQLFASRP